MIQLATLVASVASPSKAAPSGGLTAWQVIVAVSVAITILAGTQQLFNWVTRRRYRRAEQAVLDAVAAQIDADEAHRSYERTENLLRSLRQQVEKDVPKEALRVYLQERSGVLAERLAEDAAEYEDLQARLADLTGDEPTALDARVRAVIESAIQPAATRRRRADRTLVVLLAALLILSVVPFPPGDLIRGYFDVIENPGDYLFSAVINVSIIAIVMIAAVAVPLVRSYDIRRGWATRSFLQRKGTVAGVLGCGLSLCTLGILAWRHSSALFNSVSTDSGSSAADDWSSVAVSLLVIGTPLAGVALGAVAARLRVGALLQQRFHRGRRAD